MPDLYIITGANGAGKSTVGSSYLPADIQANYPIFDGDKLAMQKQREFYKAQTPSLKEAGRMALAWLFKHFEELVTKALEEKDNFVYEGHFPENANWATPNRFKIAGYKIHFIFFGLKDTDLSELRVMDRAKSGGHNVPTYEIERNFYGNLYQLNKKFAAIDELQIVDTSESIPKVLAFFSNGQITSAVHHDKLPEWFEKHLPNLFKIIIEQEALTQLKEKK
jgi:predicted ABC-type ATPase